MFLRKMIKHSLWIGYCCTPVFAASLSQSIAGLIQRSHLSPQIGIAIKRIDTAQWLYKKNSGLLYTPASIQKIFTATGALIALGPDFRFATRLLIRGPIVGHTLQGDLVVKFSGDPSLSSQALDDLLGALKKQGIIRIAGHIYIDDSAFDRHYYPPGWVWEDLSYGFAAPLSAVIVDENRFKLKLSTKRKKSLRPVLTTELPDKMVTFYNHVRITRTYKKACPLLVYSNAQSQYRLAGCLVRSKRPQYRLLAIRDPIRYARKLIDLDLKNAGIIVTHRARLGRAKRGYRVLTTHYSPALPILIHHLLKVSDNLTADALLKAVGNQAGHIPSTWTNSLLALKSVLNKSTGIHFDNNLLNDGAGLSRYNLLSPRQFIALLFEIYRRPLLREVIFPALPVAGRDGTLENRLTNEPFARRIHAKTGSMTGVSTLAGYVENPTLGPLAFSIMINGFVGKRALYTSLENQLALLLSNYKG